MGSVIGWDGQTARVWSQECIELELETEGLFLAGLAGLADVSLVDFEPIQTKRGKEGTCTFLLASSGLQDPWSQLFFFFSSFPSLFLYPSLCTV